MTQIEKLCQSVNSDIRPQVETLAKAVIALQEKIEQQIPTYEKMPLAQTVKVGTGEKMVRQNPAVQEFRATVREYATALNNLKELLDNNRDETKKPAEVIRLVGNSKWKRA